MVVVRPLTLEPNFHTTQVVSLDPVMRCSPVPTLSNAIHVTMSERKGEA